VPFNVFDVIEFGGQRVCYVNDNDLPVRLTLVQEGHNTENLDLLDLSDVPNLLADFANIEWVIIALGFSLSMRLGRVFPSL
jgi:hypothetical protein